MLFRYTENPPENAVFQPEALRVPALASAYTENSCFRYSVGSCFRKDAETPRGDFINMP